VKQESLTSQDHELKNYVESLESDVEVLKDELEVMKEEMDRNKLQKSKEGYNKLLSSMMPSMKKVP
jgi:molecular chaperone GrpE (heat shock protein)